MAVNLPLTGSGGTTATVATDSAGSAEYQFMKLVDGAAASTQVASVQATTPTSALGGLVTRPIGSTAYTQAAVLIAGSTANTVGSVALVAGTSANVIGSVGLNLGTTLNYQFMQSIPFSSGNIARSSVSTTIDIQIIAANASRKALIIANRSTAQTVGIGFSTAVLTTALANVDFFIGPSSYVSFGLQGGLPLALGPLRGINLTSTTVAGSVALTEFT